MSVTEYRETIDFTWVLARHLDRILESYSRIDPREPVHGLRRLYVALRGLLVAASPFINYGELRQKLRDAVKQRNWGLFDEVLSEVIITLNRKGLLIRYYELARGEYGADSEQGYP